MRYWPLIICICLTFTSRSDAQTGSDTIIPSTERIALSGKVVDEKSLEPLPFASVVVKNTTIGTTANAEGEFVLHLLVELQDQTLQISMIGYESAQIPIASIKDKITIKLKISPTILKEVVVRDVSPKEILKRAFQNKTKNYPATPFQFEGYYREVQRADGKNVSLVEAFAFIHDDGYQTGYAQKYFLKQLRIAESYSNPVAPFWDKNNLMIAFMNQNFVKFNKSYRQYKVKRMDDIVVDGVLVYVLELDKKWSLWPSLIYIRSDNYAIIRTEEDFSVAKYGVREWKVEDNPMMNSYPQVKTLQINYRLINGKYYPENYRMHFKNIYKDVITKKEMLAFEISQQFVVTRLYIDDLQPVNQEEALGEHVSLKKLVMPFNPSFWEFSPIKDTPVDSLIRVDLRK